MESLKRMVVVILIWEARMVLRRYKPRIIAITGSVGKTTTKDAVCAVIAPHLHVRGSKKSYNGELGVALTVLDLDNAWRSPWGWLRNIMRGLDLILRTHQYPAWLVLEIGADRPGDIRGIARWLKPDIALITGVSDIPAHVEFFDSPEHVFKEKRALAENLRAGGTLILNGDDYRMRELRTDFRGASITYGYEGNNDFYATHDQIQYEEGKPVGVQFRVNHVGSSIPVSIYGALGMPRIYAGLAAIAVADAVGIDEVSAAGSLSKWAPPPGRVRLLHGLKGSTIIDDSYNSSPAAALAALDTLKATNAPRRIAVLGDMLELGKFVKDAHRQVGERAAVSCDMLITIGIRARAIAEAALDAGMPDTNILQFESFEVARAADELARTLKDGDLVLVKGSQSMRLERFVLGIMAEPARAEELLVRMEHEWQMR